MKWFKSLFNVNKSNEVDAFAKHCEDLRTRREKNRKEKEILEKFLPFIESFYDYYNREQILNRLEKVLLGIHKAMKVDRKDSTELKLKLLLAKLSNGFQDYKQAMENEVFEFFHLIESSVESIDLNQTNKVFLSFNIFKREIKNLRSESYEASESRHSLIKKLLSHLEEGEKDASYLLLPFNLKDFYSDLELFYELCEKDRRFSSITEEIFLALLERQELDYRKSKWGVE